MEFSGSANNCISGVCLRPTSAVAMMTKIWKF